MSENILVLTGNPRREEDNNTLADAFIKGAIKNKNKVIKVNLAEKKINGYNADNGCRISTRSGNAYDDLAELELLLEDTDVLVIVMPIYWPVISAQAKVTLGHLCQCGSDDGEKHLHIKEAILLTCGETDDAEDFMMTKTFLNMLSDFNGMKVRDMIAVSGVNLNGDINGNDVLVQAEKLGLSVGA